MAHVYSPKKFDENLRYFKVELSSGKTIFVTLSYKERLETPKELEALISHEKEILETNESALAKKQVAALAYEETRRKANRAIALLMDRLAVREKLVYRGESTKFLGYVNSETASASAG